MRALVLNSTSLAACFTLLFLLIVSLFVFFGASFPSSQTYRAWLSPSPCLCEQPNTNDNDELIKTPPNAYLQTFRTRLKLKDMTEVGDSIWATTSSTKKGGFLWARHNETYNTGHGVNIFHALYCLSMIRDTIKGSKSGGIAHSHNSKRGAHMEKSEDEMHVGHCLSYVAQSFLYSADGTLERPRT